MIKDITIFKHNQSYYCTTSTMSVAAYILPDRFNVLYQSYCRSQRGRNGLGSETRFNGNWQTCEGCRNVSQF